LSLAESKQLLGTLQRHLLQQQVTTLKGGISTRGSAIRGSNSGAAPRPLISSRQRL
jgi:hypothetical protein